MTRIERKGNDMKEADGTASRVVSMSLRALIIDIVVGVLDLRCLISPQPMLSRWQSHGNCPAHSSLVRSFANSVIGCIV